MKQLPDDSLLGELVTLTKKAENQAKSLCDLATEIDEKWHVYLDSISKLDREQERASSDL